MKVAIDWLKQLVDLRVPVEELLCLIPMRTIGTKEITRDFIELDMKGYNRADLLSMRGVAYEVAAITSSEVKFSDENAKIEGDSKVNVEIENPNLCPVYCVAKIENLPAGRQGLKVEHSNDTWIKKLSDCGLRSVDNLTDVTNLVMLEYGQPLHAFDGRAVKDETIVVRTAKQNERITTLDGKTRNLETSDLLIADPQNALGIAGVMGGKDSEVNQNTTTILLEAAIFDPSSLRKTATRLGISSEAAKRFYHGLTKKRLFQALSSAIKMYEQLGGTLTGLTIIDNLKEDVPKKISRAWPFGLKLSQEKINSLIGVNIPAEEVERYLKKLNFALSHSRGDGTVWEVTPPYFRLDINIEEDLVEEIARMYGYERIPAKKLTGEIPSKIDQSLFELIYKLKTSLVNLGLTEVQTYSFYSTDILANLGWMDNLQYLLKISNPISSETEYLRQDLWPNLLEKVAQNIKNGLPAGRQGFSDVAIFEIGKVYLQTEDVPKETYRLSLALSNGTDNPIQELHQIFQKTMSHPGGEKMQLHLRGGAKEYFHPIRFQKLKNGFIAEVHPRILDKFGISKRVAVVEIELKELQ